MIKTFVSLLLAILLFVFGAFFENKYITNAFNEFDKRLEFLELKSDDSTATLNDALSLREYWISKKQSLHIVIPHTEIKEIDLWVSETVSLVNQKKFDEALQKIEVLRSLCIQIPRTFKIYTENIL